MEVFCFVFVKELKLLEDWYHKNGIFYNFIGIVFKLLHSLGAILFIDVFDFVLQEVMVRFLNRSYEQII